MRASWKPNRRKNQRITQRSETKNQVQNLIKDIEMLIGSYTMFLIDQEGIIRAKLSEEDYKIRHTTSALLEASHQRSQKK